MSATTTPMAPETSTPRTRRRRTGDRTLLKSVPLAWPTLLVTAASLLGWLGVAAACLAGALPLWVGLVVSSVAAFATFTPMHDASHKSVSRDHRWLNEVVGRVAALPLMAPFAAFRYLHLEHHKHTNDDHHDPDLWSGTGPRWLLPLKWASQDAHYYRVYFGAMRSRPRREAAEVVGCLAAMIALCVALVVAGYGVELLMLWVLPARLAYTALAWAFDYLPHRPHTITSRQDRFRATSVLAETWLTPFFLWQNYHLVHHLYPGVPFYRYARVWRARREELQARGAREISIFERIGVTSGEDGPQAH